MADSMSLGKEGKKPLTGKAAILDADCPRCGARSPFRFSAKDLNRRISEQTFDYYRCPCCRYIFLHPVPENLADYYPAAYYFAPPAYTGYPTMEQIRTMAEEERYKIELVRRFVSAGRLLEIGPSWGTFSYLAKKAGFDTEAIELDGYCCRFLNDVVKVKAINDPSIPNALKNAQPYNVVALWHVIEHLPDPWSALRAMAKALLPGGILVIAAPNPRSVQFRILCRRWHHLDAPRHIQLIPAALLSEEMSSLGFETLMLTNTDKGSIALNRIGWEISFIHLFSTGPLQKSAAKIGQYVSALVKPLEERKGLGSAYTIIFGKLPRTI
jgi:SAM-dependent methyltransferase